MSSSDNPAGLIAELDGIDGLEAEVGVPLSGYATFRIGGPADCVVRVHNQSALEALLSVTGRLELPFEIVGLGSNVLFPDEGLPGVVAQLAGDLASFRFQGTRVTAGGGMTLARLAKQSAAQGLQGLEALAGFPSTVGGAVFMNAGSYGVEIKDVLVEATVLERDGRVRQLSPEQLEPSYRQTNLRGTGAIVVSATFQLQDGNAEKALQRIEELNRRRWASLPSGRPNAGSIFRNPEGDYAGRLIEACGLKGACCGDAQISPEHANVIVNNGRARADEVLELMLQARRAVEERFGVQLVPEVQLLGPLRERWRSALGRGETGPR